ncbi:Protein translocase complex [Macleaya cordata]|uniref:Protein translocase complex n=1 Tax=Macleaya cordata TaxID=56857 RepID=A0A200R6X1_MACCD|nr:Protein translocase complex [Macleaya cordata]
MAVRLPTSSSSVSLLRFPTRITHSAGNSNLPQPALSTHQHKSPHFLSLNLHHSKTTTATRRRNLHYSSLIKAIQDGNEENPTTTTTTTTTNQSSSSSSSSSTDGESDEEEKKTLETFSGGVDELGAEIKETMKNIKEKESESDDDKVDFWSGVAEEIKEIEWPVFGKVLGITGVVLGVIAGSSVVLLTVNAVLAELSDQVFAGKGVQDFFG